MLPFIICISVISALLLLCLLTSFITYRTVFYSSHELPDVSHALEMESFLPYKAHAEALIAELASRPYERIEIESHDGIRLVGRYYRTADGAPVDILFHGYKSAGEWDFSGGANECIRMGHNVLLVDQRAHAESGGRTISFGVNERYDVLSWCRFAKEKLGDKIFIWGISMGAASVLMALDLPLPEEVLGAVADCPYSSPEKIIKRVGGNMHLPMALLFPFVRLGAVLFGGFRLADISAERAVRSAKIPVLLIHGTADNFVPLEMSEEIKRSADEAGADVSFHAFPDARHGISYLTDSERYRTLASDFIAGCLRTDSHMKNEHNILT